MAWWSSIGNELSSWPSACVFLFYANFTVCVPFPFGVLGMMWISIVSLLIVVAFFIYFTDLEMEWNTLIKDCMKYNTAENGKTK